jgi:integrase
LLCVSSAQLVLSLPSRAGEGCPQELEGDVVERFLGSVEWLATRRVYRDDLNCWLSWCALSGVDSIAACEGEVERWCAYQRLEQSDRRTRHSSGAGRKDSLVRRRLGTLSRLMRFAIDEGERSAANPVAFLERPRAQDPDAKARWLSREEVSLLLEQAQCTGPLAHALCSLLVLYGQPGTHTSLLTVADVTDGPEQPTISLAMRRARRITVSLEEPTLSAIRSLDLPARQPEWPLFASETMPALPIAGKDVGRLVSAVASAPAWTA